MKKVLCFIAACSLALSLFGCSKKAELKTENGSASDQSTFVNADDEVQTSRKTVSQDVKENSADFIEGESEEIIKQRQEAFNGAMQAYKKYLQKIEKDGTKARFSLICIDSDIIPELAVIESDSTGCKVFRYSDGKAAEIGTYGVDGEMKYYASHGLIYNSSLDDGVIDMRIYELAEDSADLIWKAACDTNYFPEMYYDSKGNESTEEQIIGERDKYLGVNLIYLKTLSYSSCSDINEENIRSILKV